jgi:hypothetical protein
MAPPPDDHPIAVGDLRKMASYVPLHASDFTPLAHDLGLGIARLSQSLFMTLR